MGRFNEKVFEAVSAGIICLDSEFKVTHHNCLGARSVGLPADENFVGKQFFEVACDNLFGLQIAFHKVLKNSQKFTFWGHPVSSFAESHEKTFWDFTVNRLDDGVILSAVEVTDRVYAERSLQDAIEQTRQSSDKLQSVVGQMTDGVIVCDSAGSITRVNRAAAEMFGEQADELVLDGDQIKIDANRIKQTDGSDFSPAEYPWNLACAQGKTTIDKEMLVRRANDEAIISINAAPLFDKTERIAGSVTVLRDVTENRHLIAELRDANRQLEEYNRLKAEFVANMSHELRTPLTAIIGFAQLMQLKYEQGEKMRTIIGDSLERILRNGRHLLTLIDEVLDLSKIEAGRLTLHLDHFELPELVSTTFASLESLALEKNLDYKLEITGDYPFVFSDSARIRQILMNLLSNAVKFTQAGKIEVKLQPQSETEWSLSVRDTGVGIEPENLDKIFERFRQVDGSYTRKVGGFGLGLSISQHLAELLGGAITVESKAGEGSVFTLTLPFVAPRAIRTLAPADGVEDIFHDAAFSENDEGRHQILVIDDIPDSTQILSQMLKNAGFRVAVAHSGAEGVRMAKKILPDAVTLDVMMPGMDGWRVLQAMKADPQLAGIPVVVVSIVDNKPLGYRLGASDYLVKPVEPTNLLETLNNVIPSSHEDHEDYILVVDDEQGVRELLLAALKQGGFKTRSAASGEIAFAMSQKNKPKAILTDLHMPGGMSGYELVARLRSKDGTAHTPIIIITGKDLMEEDRRLVSGQIADVIRKGDLMLTDLDVRLRESLAEIGVTPNNGNNNAG